jgi:hypothetical protein
MAAPPGGQAGDVLAAEADPAPVRPELPGQQVEHGGLAGTVGADHAEGLPFIEADAQIVDHLEGPEAQTHLLHGENGHRQLAPIGSSLPAAGICGAVLLLTITSS